MNGYARITADVGADFAPSARLNSADSMIGVVAIARGIEIVAYSAEEARRYAAAFTEVAGLLDEAARGRDGEPEADEGCPRCHAINWGQTPFGQPECASCGYVDDEPIADVDDDEPGPDPGGYDPGPEVDDEGGMSEYRYLLPEDYLRGGDR